MTTIRTSVHCAILVWVVLAFAASTATPSAADDEARIPIRPFGGSPAAGVASTEIDPVGADPVALAVGGDSIYWAEYRTGRIRRASLDGDDAETLVDGLDGPVALAIDSAGGHIYWATDGNFPRRLQRARLDGSDVETLLEGDDLNRPGAIAVDPSGQRLYWTESVSGRLRRADLDGASVENLYDQRILTSFGLVIERSRGRLLWTDLTHSRIESAHLDGTGVEEIAGETDGLDVPAGLALDEQRGVIYWADLGAGTIRRARLDGHEMETVVGSADGVLGPRAVALDTTHGRIYWTEVTTDRIRRAALDGSAVEDVVALPSGFEQAGLVRVPSGAPAGLRACGDALSSAGARYASRQYAAIATCLDKMSFVKAVKWRSSDPALAAATCARSLVQFGSAAGPVSTARAALAQAVASACTPTTDELAAEDLGAVSFGQRGARCAKPTSGGGVEAWAACAADHFDALVLDAVAARYARSLEWLEEARPFIRALHASADLPPVARALAALDSVYGALEKRTPQRAWKGAGYPATGLRTSYPADKSDGSDEAVAVADDGTTQAGSPLRFRDDGDGTVTDLNTGLMWEKKCDGCGGLHDYLFGYAWSGDGTQDTIWDWLDRVNSESEHGFAGYSDWRIANVKELVGIIDYERFNPAVTPAFDGALCGLGCRDVADPECSCTASSAYWSATTFSDFPAHAVSVLFNLGLVADDVKTQRHFVRAVRTPH